MFELVGVGLHPEIKYKKADSWCKLYGDCDFLCLMSQCRDHARAQYAANSNTRNRITGTTGTENEVSCT
eukprot:1664965-Rhodomonas_salina.2